MSSGSQNLSIKKDDEDQTTLNDPKYSIPSDGDSGYKPEKANNINSRDQDSSDLKRNQVDQNGILKSVNFGVEYGAWWITRYDW